MRFRKYSHGYNQSIQVFSAGFSYLERGWVRLREFSARCIFYIFIYCIDTDIRGWKKLANIKLRVSGKYPYHKDQERETFWPPAGFESVECDERY